MANFAGLKINYGQLTVGLKAAKSTVALAAALPRFFRERVTVQQAEEEIKRLLDNRVERFLELARTEIYERPSSPYLKLLNHAGCEFSDLRAYVYRQGLEETLEQLAREGVYLTADEFKGKKEVVREQLVFRVSPDDFEPLNPSPGLVLHSSGTRNRPVPFVHRLAWLAIRALGTAVFLSAHGLYSYTPALYDSILPGSGAIHLLINSKLGKMPDRWFARKVPVSTPLAATYFYLTTYLLVLMGKWFGSGFPKPEFLDISDIHRIVHWVAEKRREGEACYIITITSSAARIAQVAWGMGVSLEGTKFSVAGEPFTEAKEEVIKRVGASTTSRYGYGGGVNIGFGCANPSYRDELHVDQNMLALICHPKPLAGIGSPIHPLLCSTLHPMAPRLFLNVESGDYATLEKRDCGCALERVGLTLHLHTIRSYEKLTSEGMNYFYDDLFEVLERTIPSEFGGRPGDYQLVEEEDDKGQTRLTLLVDPAVGDLNEENLLSRLQQALGQGSPSNRFMSKVWQDAGTFRIKRQAPYASARGKILPLHIRSVR